MILSDKYLVFSAIESNPDYPQFLSVMTYKRSKKNANNKIELFDALPKQFVKRSKQLTGDEVKLYGDKIFTRKQDQPFSKQGEQQLHVINKSYKIKISKNQKLDSLKLNINKNVYENIGVTVNVIDGFEIPIKKRDFNWKLFMLIAAVVSLVIIVVLIIVCVLKKCGKKTKVDEIEGSHYDRMNHYDS